MSRAKTHRTNKQPYHIYNQVLYQEFYDPLLKEKIWSLYEKIAYEVTTLYEAQIHLLLMMNNHYHMILFTPLGNIDQIMHHFQKEISLRNFKPNSLKHRYRFNGRYKWRIIRCNYHYSQVYKYILRNPLESGICNKCEDYKYSSFYGQIGNSKLNIPIFDNKEWSNILPECLWDRSEWINYS